MQNDRPLRTVRKSLYLPRWKREGTVAEVHVPALFVKKSIAIFKSRTWNSNKADRLDAPAPNEFDVFVAY